MLIRVTVTTDAKRDEVKEVREGVLHIRVREPREENRANNRVRELVAEHYGRSVSAVRITRGHHASSKHISILE